MLNARVTHEVLLCVPLSDDELELIRLKAHLAIAAKVESKSIKRRKMRRRKTRANLIKLKPLDLLSSSAVGSG